MTCFEATDMCTSKESSRQALSCDDLIRTVEEISRELYSLKVGRLLWSEIFVP